MFGFSITFLIIVGLQIFFLLALLVAFYRKPRRFEATPTGVSVIVCAHDEEHNLRELVPLLLQQDYPDFEVIVVEDRSNDGTYDYLREMVPVHVRLKMVRVESTPAHIHGKKFALTLGIRAARYEWVLLTDADCRPASTQWVREMSRGMAGDTQFVLGYSPYQVEPGLLNAFVRFESLITALQYLGFAQLGKPYMGVGRNLAYRKSFFIDKKGFKHLDITGGDDDLYVNEHARKDTTAVIIGSQSLMWSRAKKTWRDWFTQKLRHLSVGRFYQRQDRFLLGSVTISWILTWLLAVPALLLSGPWLWWLIDALLLRWVLLIWLTHDASRKLGAPFESWKTPFLDILYAIYYLVLGPVAARSKKVRWKN